MRARTDYGQLAAKLDYTALDEKLEQLSQRNPPKTRKTAADVLEPLREKLLALHRKGWTSGQLVEELKSAGVPVSPARFRECLSRWTGGNKAIRRARPSSQTKSNAGAGRPATPLSQAPLSKDGSSDQSGSLKLGQT